ncbi:MAG: disulfide bond formation protein DsbA [Sandaracinus sp.]|nr:disulfide bond formation protein DsbA [Sandaracinus sp.]|tara:strand:+ start:1041 stop:1658 length:618 start_codon:yes stop_codon:yes gene_type:complete
MTEPRSPRVEFFFDTSSPYTYLASTQMAGLAERTGATVEWRPFLLGGLFQSIGNQAPATLAARGRYMARDLQRWARRYGVPFNWPSRFPMNTIPAQRMLVALREAEGDAACASLAARLFTAYWVDDADLKDPAVLTAAATGAGFDGAALLERTQDPAVKEGLKAATAEAEQRGAFGAPTFYVGGEMFFGNDRLLLVEDALMETRA